MGFTVTRLRAAACSVIAVGTLLMFTAAVSAAPAAPSDVLPSENVGTVVAPAVSITTAAPGAAAARVISDARSHLGARYVYGAQGPRTFDCSGLVLRVYADAGLVKMLGGWGNRSGYALYAYGRRHHLVSTTHGQPGDVVVWGGGGHVGIYLGHGMAISALVSGVRIHGIHAVTKRFTAFIHTGLAGTKLAKSAKPSPTSSSTPASSASAEKHARYARVALRLRSAAATSASIVRTLSSGTRLLVQRSVRDSHHRIWYQVKVAGRSGWVAGWLTRT